MVAGMTLWWRERRDGGGNDVMGWVDVVMMWAIGQGYGSGCENGWGGVEW